VFSAAVAKPSGVANGQAWVRLGSAAPQLLKAAAPRTILITGASRGISPGFADIHRPRHQCSCGLAGWITGRAVGGEQPGPDPRGGGCRGPEHLHPKPDPRQHRRVAELGRPHEGLLGRQLP